MNEQEAYRKGYEASKRTTTYDMESAYYRFVRINRIGDCRFERAFTDGWVDYAADNGFDENYRWELVSPEMPTQGSE